MDTSASSTSPAWILASWPPCSPFVSLTALSALILLLLPNELMISRNLENGANPKMGNEFEPERSPISLTSAPFYPQWVPRAIIPAEEEFACGGGPFSFTAASLISISCDRSQIHSCCEVHDVCYEQYNVSQSQCDDQFCACMDAIRYSTWCDNIAQPGLCLATRVFGHMFHWSTKCETSPEDEQCRALMFLQQSVAPLSGQEIPREEIGQASSHTFAQNGTERRETDEERPFGDIFLQN